MQNYKNKLLGLAFLLSISPFVSAHAVDRTVNTAEGAVIVNSDLGLLEVTSTGSTPSIQNNANITTLNNMGATSQIQNYGTATIGTINGNSGVLTNLEIFVNDTSSVTTINNLVSSNMRIINATGDDNLNRVSVDEINNYHRINDGIVTAYADIGTIHNFEGANSGSTIIFDGININTSSTLGSLINDANTEIRGDFTIQGGSTLGSLTNAGNMDNVKILSGSTVTGTITNNGAINQSIEVSGGSTANSIVNNSYIQSGVSVDTGGTVANITNTYTNLSQVYFGDDAVLSGSLTNSGTINYIISDGAANIAQINNTGTIGVNGIFLEDSIVGTINNSGSILGSIFINDTADLDDTINIINSGLITGDVFLQRSDGNSLTLNQGSQIDGTIIFSESTLNTITIGAGEQEAKSYNYSGDFSFTPYNSNLLTIVRDGSSFSVVSNAAVEDTSLGDSLRSSINIGNLIAVRLNQSRQNDDENSGVEVAYNERNKNSDASNLDLGFNAAKRKTFFWAEAFGSYDKRSSYKSNAELEMNAGGIILGADKKIAANQRVGGFVGALNGSTDIGSANNISLRNVDSKGLFAGAYLSNDRKPYFVDFALIAGVIENDSNRVVNSSEIAAATYNNVFVTPSVTFGKKLDSLPIITSLALRYTGQVVETSEESGSSANIKTKGRYLSTVSSRLQFESDNKGTKIANGTFKINARAGLEANRIIGSQNVNITVLEQNVTLVSNSRKYNIDGFVGLNTSYNLQDNVKLYADIEGSKGVTKNLSNNDLGLYGKFGVRWSF